MNMAAEHRLRDIEKICSLAVIEMFREDQKFSDSVDIHEIAPFKQSNRQRCNNILTIQNAESNAFAFALFLLFRMGITRSRNGISFLFCRNLQ